MKYKWVAVMDLLADIQRAALLLKCTVQTVSMVLPDTQCLCHGHDDTPPVLL